MPTQTTTRIRDRGCHEVVVALRRMVMQGRELPVERRLSEELGANRYVVRQALKTLREEGLITPPKRPRAPLWRHEHVLRHTSPPELWETRLTFEPRVAGMAALHGTPRQIDEIAELHAAGEPDRFDRSLDIAFHRAIAAASHNALAHFLVERLTEITLDPGFQGLAPPLTRETGYSHHQAMVDAIVARRPAAAERAMAIHLHAILLWSRGLGRKDMQ